jgi:adenosine deaminase
VILGIKGKDHPFSLYRKFGVPMALSTDDEGVSRIDLTNEYVRAVESYYLSYADLKHLVRKVWNTAFLPSASLWASPDFSLCRRLRRRGRQRGQAALSLRDVSQRERKG